MGLKEEPGVITYNKFHELISSYTLNFPKSIEESLVIRSYIDDCFNKNKYYHYIMIAVYIGMFVTPYFIQLFADLEARSALICLSIAMLG